MDRTGVALQRTGVALQRTGDPPDRTGGAIERSRHVFPLEPAAAHTAGPLIAPKEHLRPTGLCSYVRTHVRASRWKILFTPYLVIELSPSAEIWCVCDKYQ